LQRFYQKIFWVLKKTFNTKTLNYWKA